MRLRARDQGVVGEPSPRHIFDGGRSRAVREGLDPLLEEARSQTDADVGIALHTTSQGRTGVLAVAGQGADLPLVNEEIVVTDLRGRTVALHAPRVLADVVLQSRGRPWRRELSSALVVPWAEETGKGVVLIGLVAGRWLQASRLSTVAAYRQRFAAVHRDASLRGTMTLADDLAAACRAVDHAELEATESGELLASVATIARGLVGTSAAYVAMAESDAPVDGDRGAFPFAALVGIRTGAFRRLRMTHDQGLGGLARRERTTVRTMDYSGDCRLRGAPVKETREEGIVSAMCTPLMLDGAIQGSLYLGDRRSRAFSDTDAKLLEEFAGHASLRLRRQHVEEHRIRVLRQRERERLASALHDSVVRSLVEIGYRASEGRLSAEDSGLRDLLCEISSCASSTLENLRAELAGLGGSAVGGVGGVTHTGELIEALRLLPRRPGVSRTFELRGLGHGSDVSTGALQALSSVGQEAITNAERHSGCVTEQVVIERVGDMLRLVVTDDGYGLGADAATASLSAGSGHLGLRTMRSVTRALGGYTRVDAVGPSGGTRVVAAVPWREAVGS